MGSVRPVDLGRIPPAGALLITLSLALAPVGCAFRPPRLVPPPGEVEAVEGFGTASVAGAEASLKGKFGFVFRRPGLGRVEAVDPIGRTAFLIVFRGGRAWFALPGRKVYAEDEAGVMMERFLGVAFLPDDVVRLLAGRWETGAPPPEDGWLVTRDAERRVRGGVRGDFSFAVRAFFPGDAVPREIGLEGPAASGRVKVLKLGFNPPPREEAFATDFVRVFALKSWPEILELIER
ncbi:MAG TPA: hypothetical protein VLJ16_10795 [Acidobacteriota bacterium]|nr:hypothetical protein [Acidobacteriota bacterium]